MPENSGTAQQGDSFQRHPILWTLVALSPALAAVIILLWSLPPDWEIIAKTGFVQPAVAALLAFSIVLVIRLTWGGFSNETRKGTISASSATIAVKLWAVCFALLFGSMLLSSLASKWPEGFRQQDVPAAKPVETQLEVSTNQSAPVVAKAKVTR
jgi:hypothetical protein